jgi:hypothetical protein
MNRFIVRIPLKQVQCKVATHCLIERRMINRALSFDFAWIHYPGVDCRKLLSIVLNDAVCDAREA